MSEIRPTWQGEVQLRRWSESNTQGVQVTFALPDSGDLEPFKAKAGKRFMAVLVEIGDDEQPVPPPRPKYGPLCMEAVMYCKNPDFLLFVARHGTYEPTEKEARTFIVTECGVKSRKDLDTDPNAYDWFVRQVRAPFARWQREQRQAA